MKTSPIDTSDTSPQAHWDHIQQLIEPGTRKRVQGIVQRDADQLAGLVHQALAANPATAPLLGHEAIKHRLQPSIARWLRALFAETAALDAVLNRQRRAGEVQARMGVKHGLVTQSARIIKRGIAHQLLVPPAGAVELTAPAAPGRRASAVQFAYEMIDLAVDAMGDSASQNAARLVRSDESYRLFFLSQNLRAERERQKSRLLQWAQELLAEHYWNAPQQGPDAPPVQRRKGAFELWLEHKAAMVFERAPELATIRAALLHIDSELLPQLARAGARHADAKPVVANLHQCIAEITGLVDALFDRAADGGHGRDDVTRLLNRRYVPSIVKREIVLAHAHDGQFAVLMLDIDRFADIQHALGAEMSDRVIMQLADTLSEHVRAGDFVFRVGDGQFLVVLVDTGNGAALAVAEGLRLRVQDLRLRASTGLTPQITASIGVALFDGHPDYQRLLERAEAALREAKAGGHNRVAQAPDWA